MKCKICGMEGKKYVKISKGTICVNCYNALPKILRNHVEELTAKQLMNAKKVVKKCTEYYYWLSHNDILFFDDNSLYFDDCKIDFKDLEKIELIAHPKKDFSVYGAVDGQICLSMVTKKPKMKLEKAISPPLKTIYYHIHGREITYEFDAALLTIINCINKIIKEEALNLSYFKKEIGEVIEKQNKNTGPRGLSDEEYETYLKEMWENKKRRNQTEQKREEQKRQKSYQQKQYKQTHQNNKGDEVSEFDKAKMLFGLEIPYTKKELKEKRNELIKKVHPDEGGSDLKAAVINEYYSLLAKFCIEDN